MQYTSVPQWHTCYYPIPNQSFNQQHIRYPLNRFITTTTTSLRTTTTNNNNNVFTTTHYVTTTNTKNHNNQETNPENTQITRSLVDSCSVSQPRKPDLEEFEETDRVGDLGFFPGMSWVEFKAALGQRINFEGIVSSVGVLARDRHLAIPNLGVTDIRFIDWGELKRRGFQGIVFDKDNTLTIPYNLRLCEPLGESFGQCRSLFGDNVAVFSNSAGLHEYDPDGRKAKALERAIGIKVIKHRVKKPAGTAEDIERHFGCDSSKLIMVGDRPFTDIVYGNRNGFLTILTKPLSVEEEPFIVKQMRILEVALVNYWCRKGLKATNHRLLPQPKQCVKEQPW